MTFKQSNPILIWLAISAVILIYGSFLLVSEIEKEKNEGETTTTTTTIILRITTTTTTAVTTTTTIKTITTTTRSTTTTSSTTTTTIVQKIKTCDDYCVRNGYTSGTCRTHPMACAIKGVNEVYSPGGGRYCPRGEVEDTCCCVTK